MTRLKRSLVESLVGAIALGWLFAQGVLHLAYFLVAPVTGRITRSEYRTLGSGLSGLSYSHLWLRDAGLELARSVSLLTLTYLLLRWLYFRPFDDKHNNGTVPGPPENPQT